MSTLALIVLACISASGIVGIYKYNPPKHIYLKPNIISYSVKAQFNITEKNELVAWIEIRNLMPSDIQTLMLLNDPSRELFLCEKAKNIFTIAWMTTEDEWLNHSINKPSSKINITLNNNTQFEIAVMRGKSIEKHIQAASFVTFIGNILR